jgi:hypothetical protein
MKQTAVEWLAEKYDYAYWMVKRDEISPALAEEWKKHYLEQAKEMEKEQIIEAHEEGFYSAPFRMSRRREAEQYYKETFKS